MPVSNVEIQRTIMMVVLSLDMGGLEKMVIDLAKGLKRRNYKIVLCCLEEYGVLYDDIKDYFDEAVCLEKQPGLKIGLAFDIYHLAKKYNSSIIHSHNSAPHFYSSLASCLSLKKYKNIHTKHGRNAPNVRRKVFLNRISSFLSNKIVTVSDDAKNLAVEIERSPRKRTVCIENGIDLKSYLSLDDKHDVNVGEKFIIGTIGRISVEKNQSLLIKAYSKFLQEYPNSELRIVGDGKLSGQLKELVTKLGIGSSVIFTGSMRDVTSELEKFNLFVNSSSTEGMPLVIIEAMAAGVPIIATDVGGLSEMIENNVNGVIVPPEDILLLSNAMKSTIDDYDNALRMADISRKKAIENYGLDVMVDNYIKLYDEIAG